LFAGHALATTLTVMAKKRRKVKKRGKRRDKTRVLIVEARFYGEISDALLRGATRALDAAGAGYDVITVPGALEIPAAIVFAVDAARRKLDPYDGVVALGCVIRGETYHFEIVSDQSARALMDLGVNQQLAIGNGILTVENEAQAHARAGIDDGDKGGDAAGAALAMVRLKRGLAGR
jgi:6,7-dimethyl-8-ribityllumazine synthase